MGRRDEMARKWEEEKKARAEARERREALPRLPARRSGTHLPVGSSATWSWITTRRAKRHRGAGFRVAKSAAAT